MTQPGESDLWPSAAATPSSAMRSSRRPPVGSGGGARGTASGSSREPQTTRPTRSARRFTSSIPKGYSTALRTDSHDA